MKVTNIASGMHWDAGAAFNKKTISYFVDLSQIKYIFLKLDNFWFFVLHT